MNKTQNILRKLRDYESRNVTFVEPDGSWPIVWERASGVHVWDAEGRKYLDLTGAFGVAAAGHANPKVVRAGQRQMGKLLHAMGDVHPHALKAELARELSRITFERWSRGKSSTTRLRGKTLFCNSGFEAVEAALKTALLATGKAGIIAFEGGYHGLGHGALNATHREHFRAPFTRQLAEFAKFSPFPKSAKELKNTERELREILKRGKTGAILVEPIQARGGIHIPPAGFLPLLRRLCNEFKALLILDEIYTGFGRTGKWFACEHSRAMPDIICLGKALTGGFPLSAMVGRAAIMDTAWPETQGEAIHTSTFLGHPVGCAMALAQMRELEKRNLIVKSDKVGKFLLKQLQSLKTPDGFKLHARAIGLMAGIEITQADGSPATEFSLGIIKKMLHSGYILLPEGEHANVISFTPPLTITTRQIKKTVRKLRLLLS